MGAFKELDIDNQNTTEVEEVVPELDATKTVYAPEDLAAAHFSTHLPIFEQQVDHLSRGDLRILIKMLMRQPLESTDNIKGFRSELLKNTVLIGERLLESKSIMFLSMLNNLAIQKEEEQVLTINEELEKGETNG